jgi:hypothetical protein
LWTNVFDLCGFSHVIWRISHAISHHTYPNTETDFEASTIEPFINFMTNKPRNSRLVFLYMHPFMALASTIDFFSRSFLILRGRFPLTVNHFFPILVWLPAVVANGITQGTLLTLTMQVIFTLFCSSHSTIHSLVTQGTASYLLLALRYRRRVHCANELANKFQQCPHVHLNIPKSPTCIQFSRSSNEIQLDCGGCELWRNAVVR